LRRLGVLWRMQPRMTVVTKAIGGNQQSNHFFAHVLRLAVEWHDSLSQLRGTHAHDHYPSSLAFLALRNTSLEPL
jgi:hypothetical protein